jgi:hypothetical protein
MMTEGVTENYDSTDSRDNYKLKKSHKRSGSNMVGGRHDMSMSTSTGQSATFYAENNHNRYRAVSL